MFKKSALRRKTIKTIKELIALYWEEFEKRRLLIKEITGFSTGFRRIDLETDGFNSQEFWMIGGDQGKGKTCFALNLALNAIRDGAKVLYCVTEMSQLRTIERVLAIESSVEYKELRKPKKIGKEKLNDVIKTSHRIENYSLSFVAGNVFSCDDIESWVDGEEGKFDIIFIDYIQQLLECQGTEWFAGLQTSAFKLQDITKEKKICIVALSQLSKEGQKYATTKKRSEGKTESWSLKGSSSLSQTADNILLLDRNIEDQEKKTLLKIRLQKARYGDSGIAINTYFDLPTGKISIIEEEELEPPIERKDMQRKDIYD